MSSPVELNGRRYKTATVGIGGGGECRGETVHQPREYLFPFRQIATAS